MLPFIKGTNAFCSILHKFKAILIAYRCYLVNPAWMPECMHRHDTLHPTSCRLVPQNITGIFNRMFFKPFPESSRRKPHSVIIHIYEDRMRPYVGYGIARGYKRQRLSEHLVISFDTGKHQCHVKGVGSADTYHRPACTSIFGNVPLKTVNERTDTRHKCRVDAFVKVFLFISRERRRM